MKKNKNNDYSSFIINSLCWVYPRNPSFFYFQQDNGANNSTTT